MTVSQIPNELLAERLLRPIPSSLSYSVKLDELHRRLELREIERGHFIASNHSIILGDVLFLEKAAEEIAKIVRHKDPEIVLTAESKSIYFAGKLAEALGLERFEVCRKSVKSYNLSPISVRISSTISGHEMLILDRSSKNSLKGKRVALVDDVVTTGGNMYGMEELVELSGGTVASKACIWVEGVPMNQRALRARKELVYLLTLPEFFEQKKLKLARRKFAEFLETVEK